MISLSISLPCFNEEAGVEKVINDTTTWFDRDAIDGEIIAVNDGSSDKTGEILDKLCLSTESLKVVHHRQNLGYGAAVRSGLDAATKTNIGFMDGDGQFRAEHFRELLLHLDQYQLVIGRRRKRADPLMRKANATLYNWLVGAWLGGNVRDINCAMKVWKREIWPLIRPTLSTGALFNAELMLRSQNSGIQWHQIPVPHYPRESGVQTGAKLSVILQMFRELRELKKSVK